MVTMLRVICRKNMIAAQLLMKESRNVRLQGFRMDDDFHAIFPLISVETVRESSADDAPANLKDQTPTTVYERLDNNLADEQVNGEAAAPEAERDEETFVPV
ncbi:hypothetical protein D918_01065 [Trichuris suis]|nr:hypothetical protein D918_01065 [Trichuris suis]